MPSQSPAVHHNTRSNKRFKAGEYVGSTEKGGYNYMGKVESYHELRT